MPNRETTIPELLRAKETAISVDRRIKVRPAGLATTLDSGVQVAVFGNDEVLTSARLVGALVDLGAQFLDDLLDSLDDGGGGDTITVTVSGAGGRKVTVTIN
jgi:hypothetical protein